MKKTIDKTDKADEQTAKSRIDFNKLDSLLGSYLKAFDTDITKFLEVLYKKFVGLASASLEDVRAHWYMFSLLNVFYASKQDGAVEEKSKKQKVLDSYKQSIKKRGWAICYEVQQKNENQTDFRQIVYDPTEEMKTLFGESMPSPEDEERPNQRAPQPQGVTKEEVTTLFNDFRNAVATDLQTMKGEIIRKIPAPGTEGQIIVHKQSNWFAKNMMSVILLLAFGAMFTFGWMRISTLEEKIQTTADSTATKVKKTIDGAMPGIAKTLGEIKTSTDNTLLEIQKTSKGSAKANPKKK